MIIKKKNRSEVEKEAAARIAISIDDLLKKKGKVVLAVCGGRSVQGIFELLRSANIDWHNVHIFMVDERLVPINSNESNFKLVNGYLLDYLVKKGTLQSKNIHPFLYSGKITDDLKKYEAELKELSDCFDIAILSSGEDGHIAALFPNHPTVKSKGQYFIYTHDSPKLPRERMSSSPALLSRTKICFLLFLGEEKRTALDRFNDQKNTIVDCPAKIVKDAKIYYVLTDLPESP
jgi:6-phosphogluconolactonase